MPFLIITVVLILIFAILSTIKINKAKGDTLIIDGNRILAVPTKTVFKPAKLTEFHTCITRVHTPNPLNRALKSCKYRYPFKRRK